MQKSKCEVFEDCNANESGDRYWAMQPHNNINKKVLDKKKRNISCRL